MDARALPSIVFLSAALGFFTSACSSSESDPPAVDRFTRLKTRAEEVRELQFSRDVPITTITKEEYLASVSDSVDELDDAALAELADTYGRLGFFGKDVDLRSILDDSGGWAAATYSPKDEVITLIGDVADEVVVHELVHGLQDQRFDLEHYEDLETSDADISRRAVVEGDATLAQARFEFLDVEGVDLDRLDWVKFFPRIDDLSRSYLDEATYPTLFAAYPAFLYSFGLAYCAHTLMGATRASPMATQPFPYAWSREDALFTDVPPTGAGQVMTLDAVAAGVAVGLADVPPELGARFERVDWDTLGAFYAYLLFYHVDASIDVHDPLALASAWAGDRALFLRDRDTQDVGVVWTSQWNEGAAARVEEALRSQNGFTADPAEPRLGTSSDGEVVWLERVDDRVVFLKNVPEADAPGLAAAALAPPAPRSAPRRLRPPLGERTRRRHARSDR